MALTGDAVIIEVGLNEGAGTGVDPHVPITPGRVRGRRPALSRCRRVGDPLARA